MQYIYMKELEEREEVFWMNELPKWLKKLIWKIIKGSNVILKKNIGENRELWLISNIEKENIWKKVRNKLKKQYTQNQKLQIILSKKVKQYRQYLKSYKIIDGRVMFFDAIESILEKIIQNQPMALQDIYVLTNGYQERNINLIKDLAPKVKSMNIITKEIARYYRIEELMQEQGIAVCTSNNKRKSLKKAKIIINLDFTKEELKEYTIFRSAILINIPQERITNLRGFEGIIIQDIAVEVEKKQMEWIRENKLEDSFMQLEVGQSLQEVKKEEKVAIAKLYGSNGQIDEKELQNWQKNIDK